MEKEEDTKSKKQKLIDSKNNAKAMKNALQQVNNNLKQGECLKLVTVKIDENIFGCEFGISIINVLDEANIKHERISQPVPNIITWTKEIQFVDNENDQAQICSTYSDENYAVLILNWIQIVDLIEKSLFKNYIIEKRTILSNKKVTLGLYGLQRYFKHWKCKKNENTKKKTIYDNTPKISPKVLESELTELQILAGINHRTLETPEDLNNMVLQFTKSIAEAQFKFEKRSKEEQVNCFVKNSNRDCVRVDKDGNGLQRVWQQQLMQFTLASLEIVQAITSKYPSPDSLFEAYENCTPEDGERLLQDLLIRRTAGPIAFQRKVGPEMSKKIYSFFTSDDGNTIISADD
ncbi:crossover junction endonuclease EME1 [Chrysoperla carnea]|uniref:crossover junction endonuclease EME1 n=1 Tax=Chrysoperla carnea TaxID=189513 RepID=UPI001D068FEB|nr:crossover junction endonuclease EME1 [Chrysoperla carnea]